MSQKPNPQVQKPSTFEELMRVDLENWKGVASLVKDPVAARLIVETLDAHPQLKERRIGVYLAARVTVQRSRITYARSRAAGARFAAVLRALQGLAGTLSGGFRRAADSAGATSLLDAVAVRPAASDLEAAQAHGFSRPEEPQGLTFPPIAFPEANDAATLH